MSRRKRYDKRTQRLLAKLERTTDTFDREFIEMELEWIAEQQEAERRADEDAQADRMPRW